MPSHKSPEQAEIASKNWHELHGSGQSSEASIRAYSELQQLLPSLDFGKREEKSAFLLEMARQTVVAAGAAVRKTSNWSEAYQHLHRAAETIRQVYPLTATRESALQRGDFWQNGTELAHDPVTGEPERAALICLRDLLHFVRLLAEIYQAVPFSTAEQRLRETLLAQVQWYPHNRFSLITVIEEGSEEQARQAFESYRQYFSPLSESAEQHAPPAELATIMGRHITNTLRTKRFREAFALTQEFLRTKKAYALSQPEQADALSLKAPAKELAKPLLTSYRHQRWSELANGPDSDGLKHTLKQLLRLEYFGLGDQSYIPLHPLTR